MALKSFLLSLVRVRAQAGEPAFLSRHPHPWLLWEPGQWKPNAPGTLILSAGDLAELQSGAGRGEALAWAMEIAPGRPPEVVLGRADGCDISINDGTVSSRHLAFGKGSAGQWTVKDLGSSNGSRVNGMPLALQAEVPLRAGDRLQAGQVHLTWYDSAGLVRRAREG